MLKYKTLRRDDALMEALARACLEDADRLVDAGERVTDALAARVVERGVPDTGTSLVDVVAWILDRCEAEARNAIASTCLVHASADTTGLDVVVFLLDRDDLDLDVNAVSRRGWTPLLTAVLETNVAVVDALVGSARYGADVDLGPTDAHIWTSCFVKTVLFRKTPLTVAVEMMEENPGDASLAVFWSLLRAGADVDPDYDLDADVDNYRMWKALPARPLCPLGRTTNIRDAATRLTVAEALLAGGADPNRRDGFSGFTAFGSACMQEQWDLVRLMISAAHVRPDPNLPVKVGRPIHKTALWWVTSKAAAPVDVIAMLERLADGSD